MKRVVKQEMHPISLDLPWENLLAENRSRYEAMGMTAQTWENNRREGVPSVDIDDWQWMKVRRGKWAKVRRKLLLGDRARTRMPWPGFELGD